MKNSWIGGNYESITLTNHNREPFSNVTNDNKILSEDTETTEDQASLEY